MTPGELRRLRREARAFARAAFPEVLAVFLANLDVFPREDQARLLNAAVALEEEGAGRPEVIADLMEKLIEVTRE